MYILSTFQYDLLNKLLFLNECSWNFIRRSCILADGLTANFLFPLLCYMLETMSVSSNLV